MATPAKDKKAAAPPTPMPPKGAKAAAEEPAEEAEPQAGGGKKIILIAAIAGIVGVLVGGGAGYLTARMLGGDKAKAEAKQTAVIDITPPVLVDLPEKLIDLKTGTCQAPYLRVQVSIDVPQKAQPLVANRQVQIADAIQQYLRGQERHDLVGREGADRLRNETRKVVNELIAPEQINGVLFKKFVLQ
jgi:flagellar basal body-associated protein FliL